VCNRKVAVVGVIAVVSVRVIAVVVVVVVVVSGGGGAVDVTRVTCENCRVYWLHLHSRRIPKTFLLWGKRRNRFCFLCKKSVI